MWPPQFTLRKSPRAKYIRLKISRHKGLEVVIPEHTKRYDIAALLNKHRLWIESKAYIWQLHQPDSSKPQQLELAALAKSWRITYHETSQPLALFVNQHELMLIGTGEYKLLLKRWLKQQAQLYLPPLLAEISQEIGLDYNRSSIRLQSTRWGSCSTINHISLNAKLLFLPPALVRHVIIHELCHTVHLNHSKHFWKLVAEFDQDYQHQRLALSKAEQYVPAWIER